MRNDSFSFVEAAAKATILPADFSAFARVVSVKSSACVSRRVSVSGATAFPLFFGGTRPTRRGFSLCCLFSSRDVQVMWRGRATAPVGVGGEVHTMCLRTIIDNYVGVPAALLFFSLLRVFPRQACCSLSSLV